MKDWSDFLKKFPVTYSSREASEKRHEVAGLLRDLADNIEDGTFNFGHFKFMIEITNEVSHFD